MLKFHADKFVTITSLFGKASMHFRGSEGAMENADLEWLRTELTNTVTLLADIGLSQSAKKARTILGHTAFAGYDKRHYAVSLDELKERLRDELEDRYCLCLNENEASLFAPKQSLVGAEVEAQFPSLLYDIEESAKCGGLGRDTASAFHAIRCLEAAIRALSRCLKIPDPTRGADRSWHNLLKKIEDAMKVKWPTSADRFSGDGKLFEELYGALHAMQNPYRNATMHLDAKYNKSEAEVIRILVKEFLVKVSYRMNEDGVPLA